MPTHTRGHRRFFRALLFAMIGVGGLGAAVAARATSGPATATLDDAEDRVRLRFDEHAGALVVSGWTPAQRDALRSWEASDRRWLDLLAVHVAIERRDRGTVPAVVGAYHVEGDRLLFRPRFGWAPGQRYQARLDPRGLRSIAGAAPATGLDGLDASFVVPAPSAPADAPAVSQVYPRGDAVPSNLLRVYVEFSRPMRGGDVYEHISLLDEAGVPVEGPFLRIGHELWDPTMRRLTIIIDPGRIKRGVAPNRQVGAPLRESRRYELVIDRGLRDDHGRRLAADYRKALRVLAADDSGPDPQRWELSTPSVGSTRPLSVRLDAPVDSTLALRFIRVEDARGDRRSGSLVFGDDERSFEFTPEAPWGTGLYRLVIDRRLEDYAGNRVAMPFDMPAGSVAALATADNAPVRREFRPAPLGG